MDKLERITKGLMVHKSYGDDCTGCPYEIESREVCIEKLCNDALATIEEQKKIIDLQHSAMRGSVDMIHLLFKKLDGCVETEKVKNILRSGVSLDTKADQEYVCELIDKLNGKTAE